MLKKLNETKIFFKTKGHIETNYLKLKDTLKQTNNREHSLAAHLHCNLELHKDLGSAGNGASEGKYIINSVLFKNCFRR